MIKVMVFGVFDLLHPGHISFLRQAKRLGDYLIVSVARDVNVKTIKGWLPWQSQVQRLKRLSRCGIADKVVLGGFKNPWPHIQKERPDIIALGYDQKPYVPMQELKKFTKVVRLKGYKVIKYKSSKLKWKHLREKLSKI